MKPLRSVAAQLFGALVVVVLIALATTYLVVVPTLDNQLVSRRLDELERSFVQVANGAANSNPLLLQSYSEDAASVVDARVVLFQRVGPPLRLLVQADSLRTGTAGITTDELALEAARRGQLLRGTVERGGIRRAEIAAPIAGGSQVLLLSGSLSDASRSVSSVKTQLLIAAIPSLLIALMLGLIGARALTGRIRRLERAADRIAAGSFEEPVEDAGSDEIGQLAGSFERMRQRLAQLEEARREFIATASHELRTPIFALSGSLELLADEEMDEVSRLEFLETMREQVERLRRLATALLDLSRLDAGRLDLSTQPVALAVVAETLKEEFEASAELTRHPLSAALDGSPLVLADEQRTLQIGRILLENALQHTPAGTRVEVRVASENGTGLLVVEDAGPGIPPDFQERVFERFFRLESERSSGSGLGLAIAREWAQRMNGELRLTSRPGSTVFSLELPSVST